MSLQFYDIRWPNLVWHLCKTWLSFSYYVFPFLRTCFEWMSERENDVLDDDSYLIQPILVTSTCFNHSYQIVVQGIICYVIWNMQNYFETVSVVFCYCLNEACESWSKCLEFLNLDRVGWYLVQCPFSAFQCVLGCYFLLVKCPIHVECLSQFSWYNVNLLFELLQSNFRRRMSSHSFRRYIPVMVYFLFT